MLAGKQKAIHEERDGKLEEAREDRAKIRAQQAAARYVKVLDQRIGQCWEATPWQNHHSAESMPKASANCLWPQCDKSQGLEAEPPRRTAPVFSFIY